MKEEIKCTVAVYEEGHYEFLSPKGQMRDWHRPPERLTGLEPGAYKARLIFSEGEVSIEVGNPLYLASDGFWKSLARYLVFWA